MIKHIKDIRSTHFTRKIPKTCKFRLGEWVELCSKGRITQPESVDRHHAAQECHIGKIVGLQHNSPHRKHYWDVAPLNRYYVRFNDGIYPVSSNRLTTLCSLFWPKTKR